MEGGKMLVLTRKPKQSLMLGDDIKVTILSVEGDRISIGVEAPKSVKIFRTELLEETKHINMQSLSSGSIDLKSLALR